MKSFGRIGLALATLASAALGDVDPIVTKGTKFYYKTNGTQFFIRGVAYQQNVGQGGAITPGNFYVDPLSVASDCQRDVPYLQQLNTNTIRVYAINPTADHSQCMQLLQNAGIYVIADLSAPVESESINQDSPSWDDDLYARYTSVIDSLSSYTNVIGFFAGNEVANSPNTTASAAFVKAAVRDSKAYIKNKGYRQMYVGYATNDDADIRVQLADYMNCGDQSDAVDFWGYNIYSWCGDSSFHESGYDVRTQEFETYSVPAFFAEYGCNAVQPRIFTEIQALFGDQMTGVWSGGIVYEYFQEANDYGLVTLDGNTVSTLADFNSYSKQINSISPSSTNANQYQPSNSPQACPAVNSDFEAVATPLPPTPNEELCSCMYNGVGWQVDPSVNQTVGYGLLFGDVCGTQPKACAGIAANATTGTYGAYSMCNSTQQLGFVLDQYCSIAGGTSCSWGGSAISKPTSTPQGGCSALIDQAGSAGTGTVTTQPSGTGAGAAGAETSKQGAAAAVQVHHVQVGALSAALYVAVAVLSGAAMVML